MNAKQRRVRRRNIEKDELSKAKEHRKRMRIDYEKRVGEADDIIVRIRRLRELYGADVGVAVAR